MRSLNEVEQATWLRLLTLASLLPTKLDAGLRERSGVSYFEYFVLASLSAETDGTMRMSDLAAASAGSPSRVSHAVTRMEKNGLVERIDSVEDGRVRFARLTEAGWELVRRIAPAHLEQVRKLIFDVMTTSEMNSLCTVTGKLIRSLDEDGKVARARGLVFDE
jgi:DNA-binding MarR family transcriptional regulator